MKGLRNYFNNIKPNFINDGKYNKWFPLFDALENLFFSYGKKTKNPIHVRDAVDIQKVMVTVWLATFPAMFFGMYNLGSHSLEYLDSIIFKGTLPFLKPFSSASFWNSLATDI